MLSPSPLYRRGYTGYVRRFTPTVLVIAAAGLLTVIQASCKGPAESGPVAIHWMSYDSDTEGLGIIEKAGLFIRVKLDGKDVLVQLDTGATNTIFYRQVLDRLGIGYKLGRLDPKDPRGVVYNGTVPSIQLGNRLYRNVAVKIWDVPVDVSKLESGVIKAGDIGCSLFKDSVLLLDFANDQISILNSVPQLDNGYRVPIKLVNGRPVFSGTVGSHELVILYDTGASAWPLIVTTSLFESLFGDEALASSDFTVDVTSWGKRVYLLGMKADLSLEAAGANFPLKTVWGSELVDQLQEVLGVNAIVGNALFAGAKVYIDFRGKTIVVMPAL